jgi:hypothetical protein
MQPSLLDLIHDQTEQTQEEQKEAEVEEERKKLLNHISSGSVNTLRDRVAWILNHHPETRNSDIALQLKFWRTFEPHIYDGYSIKPDDFYRLTRSESITRERRRIQNVYKLFLASAEIRERRGTLAEEEKGRAVEDKPVGYPTLVVYMDESGKNARQLIVGSIWFLGGGYPIFALNKKILEFKERVDFSKEFHFSHMNRSDLAIYKEMITLFLEEAPTVSFKLVSVPAAGIQNKQVALQQLFYHVLVRGVETEDETGRASLPRSLQVWKDSEEEGYDSLLIADLDDRLKQTSASRFDGELHIDEIRCADSHENIFLQVTDLFTASANRILNQPGTQHNHKDEFARFFLKAINVDTSFEHNDQIGDMVIHISL